MKDVLLKVLEDCDEEIAVALLGESRTMKSRTEYMGEPVILMYENWELLPDPVRTAIEWQELRDRRKK